MQGFILPALGTLPNGIGPGAGQRLGIGEQVISVVLPVRVCAGAFADGVPQADLRLSPDYAMYLEGVSVLVPIRYLINGASTSR